MRSPVGSSRKAASSPANDFMPPTKKNTVPEPLPEPYIEPADNSKITPEERRAIFGWLDLPLTKKVVRLMHGQKPHCTVALTGNPLVDAANEVRRLHIIQGWELYIATLNSLRFSPREVQRQIVESYPDMKEKL